MRKYIGSAKCNRCGRERSLGDERSFLFTELDYPDSDGDNEKLFYFNGWDSDGCQPKQLEMVGRSKAGRGRNEDNVYWCRSCEGYTTITVSGYTISIPEEEWLEIFSTK